MTSQSREKKASVIDVCDGQYAAIYTDSATEELRTHVQKLESNVEFLRSIITELYNKCPKTTVNMDKKKKKEDAVECESCGGLLW